MTAGAGAAQLFRPRLAYARTILAVICGSDGWDDIVDFAEVREPWLKTSLKLPSGIPSADTFRRVFAALDPQSLGRCFASFVAELAGHVDGKLVCIDGKTMRRTFARERGQGPLHLVSAWVADNAVTLGQLAVDAKSNELTAIPELLAMLQIRGASVTIDAAGCQARLHCVLHEPEPRLAGLAGRASQPLRCARPFH